MPDALITPNYFIFDKQVVFGCHPRIPDPVFEAGVALVNPWWRDRTRRALALGYRTDFNTAMANSTHATINDRPPSGVTAPSHFQPVVLKT